MKKIELIAGTIAILGLFLKIMYLPGSGILIVLAFVTLAMFYYVFSFALFNAIRLRDILKKSSYKDTNARKIIGAIGLGLTLSLIIVAGFFKLQLFPGGNIQLLIGLITIGLILLIAIIFYFRNKTDYYKRIFKRIAIYGILGLVLYLTPDSTLVDIYYRKNPDYAELYKKVLAAPDNIELQEHLEQMRREMENN
jgi:magnesium-transporting ATPase (P-type)